MSVKSDLDKKLTLGDADGPDEFIPELGMIVPTFIDPRIDLAPNSGTFIRKTLMHHVPFKMRSIFRPEDWPEDFERSVRYRTNSDGYVLCGSNKLGGGQCNLVAVNRSRFCHAHGGALHRADKKMSGMNVAPIPAERLAQLDRVQLFMQGFLEPSELNDDEVAGQFVRNDEGIPVHTAKIGMKFAAILTKELHTRLNHYLTSKAPGMLQVITDIAESDFVEPADRLKASIWIAERVIGKTPDVIIHGKSEKVYESILDQIEGGSRDEYRRKVLSIREDQEPIDASVEHVPEDIAENGVDGYVNGSRESGSRDDYRVSVVHTNTKSVDDAKAAKERIKKAKNRRFAARASGGIHSEAGWLVEFKKISKGNGGGYFMKLYPPEAQTEAVIARLKT